MPIYEYTCSKCQQAFEEWVKSASDSETDSYPCPQCGADAFRIISNTSFLLKGDGWFNTTYPSTSKTAADSASASEKKTETKTETK